ncbi:hypothetical protein [Aggregatibacter actinomycetemcomitans]|uniref:hypothetical protein n=2 Tax=Aggregatibacter actinomycetemcomitans TaxID=714 RepID=UPI001E3A3EDD|nr:hypothetical protein [Aggregatibacter actinomycetemcomitans]
MENSNLPTGPRQGVLDISIDKEAEINGIGMGVLGNGIPYLTQTGLAKVCDISRITLQELSSEWTSSIQSGLFTTNRMTFLSSYLFNRGFSDESLYIQVEKNGAIHYAYPDIVCMAILEFYAFESSKSDKTVAQRSYRELASLGLKEYIYRSTGYKPDDPWRHYHNRVSLLKNMGTVPDGCFIVFNEIAGMMVDLINAGLVVNQHTVPDISVGLGWAKYWKENKLANQYGDLKKCSHFYPKEFLQSGSNPQQINAYPDSSLGEFRKWFKNIYLKEKFPSYILKKTMLLPRGKETATKLIEVLQ